MFLNSQIIPIGNMAVKKNGCTSKDVNIQLISELNMFLDDHLKDTKTSSVFQSL